MNTLYNSHIDIFDVLLALYAQLLEERDDNGAREAKARS